MKSPRRIVCLSAESADILVRVGAGDRLAGVTAFAQLPPRWRGIPRVGGFSSANLDRIASLAPDLVITYSDVQARLVQELVTRGFPVLATNQRSLEEISDTIEMIGRVVGCDREARKLADDFRSRCRPRPARTARRPSNRSRPRVYFEEWNEPLVSGICWVSELIGAAGGDDIFPEFRPCRKAAERVVTSAEVARRNPDLILASWCGKKADLSAVRARPGWSGISAVAHGDVYEIESSTILHAGPILVEGLARLRRLIGAVRRCRGGTKQHT